MVDVTAVSFEEMEPIYEGLARRARATLGVSSFGMQLMTLPPNWDGYPGDERAFVELTSPHRQALHVHCYRLLGSLYDADDALQETLLRAWRGIERFEPRSAVAAWLYRIATNVCLRMLEQRTRTPAPVDA